MKCTANCPACGFNEQQEFEICPKCGVIVEKYFARQLERTQREIAKEQELIKQAEQVKTASENKAEAGAARKKATGTNKVVNSIVVLLMTGGMIVACYLLMMLSGSSIYFSLTFLLYGGGCILACCALIFASVKKERSARIGLSVFAMVALLVQGGCWQFAAGIDQATGGRDSSSIYRKILGISVVICVIWATVIIARGKSSSEARRENN
jgi:hypothetical protein